MTRGVVCLCAVLVGALLTATTIQSAPKRPRFLATISGTQHFEWTLEDSSSGSCSYKGHGEQSETFGTSRPVKVIAPPPRGGRTREFQAFSGRGFGRVVPLSGRETRVYNVLKAPSGECSTVQPELRRDCRGSNPLLPRAGVAILRDVEKIALLVPVDTPWIERRPSVCDIRIFDLRNSFLSAVFGMRTYTAVRGGRFESRARTLRAKISVRYCVDPADSSDFEVRLDTSCGPPTGRGPILSGSLRTDWTITLRRTR